MSVTIVVYMAGRYGRRLELSSYATQLEAVLFADPLAAYRVRAEWLTGKHDSTAGHECALIDFAEASAADIVISFTEPPGDGVGRARGGRHVEFGIALALRKRCIVVGHRENVFHFLDEVEFYPTWAECLEALS